MSTAATATAATKPIPPPISQAKPAGPETKPAPAPARATKKPEAELLTLADISPDPAQPRKAFDDAFLETMGASIKANGLIQPIVVRPAGEGKRGFTIIDGEQRWRASKKAGLTQVPAIIRHDLVGMELVVAQLLANIVRSDLRLAEECEAVARVVAKEGSVQKAAIAMGLSEAWVSKRAGVLAIPPQVKDLVRDGLVADVEIVHSIAQARALDEKSGDELVRRARKPRSWEEPLTRESARSEVVSIRERLEWQERRRKEEEAAAKREANASGKAKKLSAIEAKADVTRRGIERVKTSRKPFREAAVKAVYDGLALKKSGALSTPFSIEYSYGDFNSYTGGSTPRSTDGCHFDVYCHGNIAHLKRVAAGFKPAPKVIVDCPDLTLDQAQRLSDALKDVTGLSLHFEVKKATGASLRDTVKRLAPKLADTLPENKTAAEPTKAKKKAQPAAKKPAAKAKKK